MARYSSPALLFLFLCGISLTNSLQNGFSVELIHRDSPKSPFHRPGETHFQRVSNAVRRSFNRVNRFHKDCTHTKNPESYIASDELDYIISYSIGTPPFQTYGNFDTGSGFIWLQCQPCKLCYNQSTPIFDPSKSKTYKTLPCSSRTCKQGGPFNCSSSNTCLYEMVYGTGLDESSGDVSLETLTLKSTSGSPVSFPRTVIGCGHHNKGSHRGRMSGVVAVGGGPFSLINQLGSSIKGKFSYCLVPMFSGSNTSSKLNFGDAAVVSGHGVVSTPLKIVLNTFYTLTLEAFSVGNNRVNFGDSPFVSEEKVTAIDTGSLLTSLPYDIYNKLEPLVIEVVKLKRVESHYSELSLCYEGVLDLSTVPIITVHFKGADVRLNAFNTFAQVTDRVLCFTFTSGKEVKNGIFGSLAQQNFLVGYDLQKKIISFKPTNCANQVV